MADRSRVAGSTFGGALPHMWNTKILFEDLIAVTP